MLDLNLYIHRTGFISHGGCTGKEWSSTAEEFLIEPDYSKFISPMQMRRMSKAVKMGVGAASLCLVDEQAQAIAIGTALGCLNDTEFFLKKIIDQDEQMLTPTSFIQSTHNTVSGQIALLKNINGRNITYVHKGHSFAHACIDAAMHLSQNNVGNVLIGGLDEKNNLTTQLLNRTSSKMTTEGAAFLLANKKSEGSIALIQSIFLSQLSKKTDFVNNVHQMINDGEIDAIAYCGENSPLEINYDNQEHLTPRLGNYPTIDALSICYLIDKYPKKNVLLIHHSCGFLTAYKLLIS